MSRRERQSYVITETCLRVDMFPVNVHYMQSCNFHVCISMLKAMTHTVARSIIPIHLVVAWP